MHALIVVAHPDPKSLSHSVAAQLGEGVSRSGHSIEIANLAAEGFDPRSTAMDLAVHRREVPPPADAAEQARIDRADALVLVYPVYWWSMPGLLTGWIDRVLANGWAYEYSPDTGVTKKPRHLKGLSGRHENPDRHLRLLRRARVMTSELLLDSEAPDMTSHRNLFAASQRCEIADAA